MLNSDFTTTWNPGILADTPTGNALGTDGLPVRTAVCATVPVHTGDTAAAIQRALDVGTTLNVPISVILRGAGSNAATGTVIVSTFGGPVLTLGTMQDSVCYERRRRKAWWVDSSKEYSLLLR